MERVHAATRCQHCSTKLVVTGLEELQKEASSSTRHPEGQAAMGASILGGGRIDGSFLVLDPSKQPRGGLGGETNSNTELAASLSWASVGQLPS